MGKPFVIETIDPEKQDSPISLIAFVRDSEDWEFFKLLKALHEEKNYPWHYDGRFVLKKNEFNSEIEVYISKPELSNVVLKVVFPMSYWNFAKNLLVVFFFHELSKGERVGRLEGIAFKIRSDLVDRIEREILDFGLDLFYDKVLKVGNPYSLQYVEGVYESFVKNRYKPNEEACYA